jgi:hypothetical protein
VVSDLAPIAGLPAGNYRFAANWWFSNQRPHRQSKHKCLAGTGTTLLQAVNYLASLDLVSRPTWSSWLSTIAALLGLQQQDLPPTCRLCFTDGSSRIFST